MTDTFIPTTRAIWLPYMRKPKTDASGFVEADELRKARSYHQPSVFTEAVRIARSDFGCGYLLNCETGQVIQVGPERC